MRIKLQLQNKATYAEQGEKKSWDNYVNRT